MAKSKYNKDTFPLLGEKYAREGLTDIQIAKNLGISKQTFYNYQEKYIDFLDSIKRGKSPVDFQVENSLLKRALGYEFEEEEKEYKIVNGNKVLLKTTVKKKQLAPDVGAQAFWLKNRVPSKWRDRKDIEHSGKIDSTIDTTQYSEEEKELLLKTARKGAHIGQ